MSSSAQKSEEGGTSVCWASAPAIGKRPGFVQGYQPVREGKGGGTGEGPLPSPNPLWFQCQCFGGNQQT